MDKYICVYCGYIYDSEYGVYEQGIKEGTDWEDVPETFKCPRCGSEKENFEEV